MITRDYILRQIHQLVQALAQVLSHKQAGQGEQAQEVLTNALQDVTGLTLERLRQLEREELLALCSTAGVFSADKAVSMADLLREDPAVASRKRALWLYEAALKAGGAVPFDVHDRMVALEASIREESGH